MRLKDKLVSWFSLQLDKLRIHLSRPDALIQLAFLGWLAGLLAGGIIVIFRLLVEGTQASLLQGNAENYEILSIEARFLYPVIGSLIIAWVFHYYSHGIHLLGVARVMERMAYHQGYLTLRGFFLQFFGAAIAIISGHSVGREGPHVFLGAASSSLMGQYLSLPNNSIRTLVGCGTAAGIAASFGTPLAGVIFALEVVMMEYTLASFMPVILAAGSATSVSVFFFGNEAAFIVPELNQGTLMELFFVIILGVLAGAFSAVFIHMLQGIANRSKQLNFPLRVILASVLVGLIAMISPGVMGIGYDSVSALLSSQMLLSAVLILLVAKLLATVASVGLGIPGGMIGPALFLGACLGSSFGFILQNVYPELQADPGFFSLLGMGAVMGASLQAPLAALTAMMELTHSPQIIMPGIIVIVIANLTASELFRKKSLFVSVLEANNVNVFANPVTQTLRRIGVGSVMNKAFVSTKPVISRNSIKLLLTDNPKWILIQDSQNQLNRLMPAKELVHYYEKNVSADSEGEEMIDLLEIPGERFEIAPIHLQATLEEALIELNQLQIDALYVERMIAPGFTRIYGILTRSHIESSYEIK